MEQFFGQTPSFAIYVLEKSVGVNKGKYTLCPQLMCMPCMLQAG